MKCRRHFFSVIIICNEHKYCVPLSKPKKKHKKMRDKIDFKKIVYQGELIGVLNFNLMIPVEDAMIQKIDTKIRKHDNADTRKKKELLIKELDWCNERFSAREQCLDFKRMEIECKRFVERKNSFPL